MDNDPKYTGKAIQEFVKAKKWDSLQWPSQLSLNIACFSVNEVKIKTVKIEGRKINKQEATKGNWHKGLVEHLKGGTIAFGDVYWFQTLGNQ